MELDCKLDRSLVVTELCLTLYSSGCACFKTRQWSMGFWIFSSILLICVTRFILTVSNSGADNNSSNKSSLLSI